MIIPRLNKDDEAKSKALWKMQEDLSKKMKSNERKVKRRAAMLRDDDTQPTLSPDESAGHDVQEHIDMIEPTSGTSQIEATDLIFEDDIRRALEVRRSSRRRAETSSRSKMKELEMTTKKIHISTKDQLDQVTIASVQNPIRKEIDESQSHRIRFDESLPQDSQPEEFKSSRFTTYRSQEGPRTLKTSTPIRRDRAQIVLNRFDRTEIDEEDQIETKEYTESRTSPLRDSISKLKVTDKTEKAPESPNRIEEGIFEVSFDQRTTDFEGT